MSSSRSGRSLAARPVFLATRAAMAANRLAWVSLPPKPPPMRRISTVTASSGTPSTCGHDVLHLARVLGRGMDGDVAILARHGQGDLALEVEMLLAADRASGRRAGAARPRSPPWRRRAAASSARSRACRRPAPRRCQDRRQVLVVDHGQARRRGGPGRGSRRPRRRAAGRRSATSSVGEQRLVVPDGRADVVVAGHVGRGQHARPRPALRAPRPGRSTGSGHGRAALRPR